MFNYKEEGVDSHGMKKIELNVNKIIIHTIIGLVLLTILFRSFGTIGAGERGVRTRFGAVIGNPIDSGLYFKLLFIERIIRIDIKTQKEQVNASAASKDLQIVNSSVALNYSLNPLKVGNLYKEIGVNYRERIIDPAIQESVKASTARFTAEELITRREDVKNDIKLHLSGRLEKLGIIVEDFSIVNFDFSKSFNDAIEAKVTAEQNALAAKNKLSQVEYEAKQSIEKAKGEAEAIRIQSIALQNNPQILQLEAIRKWDGKMPQVTGEAIPFINIVK